MQKSVFRYRPNHPSKSISISSNGDFAISTKDSIYINDKRIQVFARQISFNNQNLLVLGEKSASIYSTITGKLKDYPFEINCADLNGELLCCGTKTGLLFIWDLFKDCELLKIPAHSSWVTELIY